MDQPEQAADPRVTTVYLLRHGEVHNPEGILYGRLPGYRLSDRGVRMAELVAESMRDTHLDLIRSSPLERALQTAEPFVDAHPDAVFGVDERLIEADSALAGQEFGKRHKALFKPKNWHLLVNPLRPSWAEPWTKIAERMQAAVQDAAAAAGPGGTALLVSHQSPIWTLRRALSGKSLAHLPVKRECRLASLTEVRLIDGRVVGIGYSEPAAELYDADANSAFSSGR